MAFQDFLLFASSPNILSELAKPSPLLEHPYRTSRSLLSNKSYSWMVYEGWLFIAFTPISFLLLAFAFSKLSFISANAQEHISWHLWKNNFSIYCFLYRWYGSVDYLIIFIWNIHPWKSAHLHSSPEIKDKMLYSDLYLKLVKSEMDAWWQETWNCVMST